MVIPIIVPIAMGLLSTAASWFSSSSSTAAGVKVAKAQIASEAAAAAASLAAWKEIETGKLALEGEKFDWLVGAYAERQVESVDFLPLVFLAGAIYLLTFLK